MTTKKRLGRLAAGASALALLSAGLIGTAASADPLPQEINPEVSGVLTIHKYDGREGEDGGDGTPITDTSGFGNGLDGVTFTVTQINVNLLTAEGWDAIESWSGNPSDLTLIGTPKTATTASGGVATVDDLAFGAYLVEETDAGPNLVTGPVAPFIVTIPLPHSDGWLYDVHVYPKNQVTVTPTPEKEAHGLEGTAQTGDEVNWTISVTVPKISDGYKSFTIGDDPGAGLTFKEWGAISIGSTVLDGPSEVTPDYTVSGSVVTLTSAGLAKLNAVLADANSAQVTAVLTTTLDADADGILTNKAMITVNGKPLDEPEGKTNWAKIVITKVSDDTEKTPLEGAVFELYARDGGTDTLIGTATTDDDGKITFRVWVGNDDVITRSDLWLKETVAPAGHVLPAVPWTEVGQITAGSEITKTLTITNKKPEGPDLPLTGAQGTLLMTVIGFGLLGAGAAAIGIRRARANN